MYIYIYIYTYTYTWPVQENNASGSQSCSRTLSYSMLDNNASSSSHGGSCDNTKAESKMHWLFD